MLDPSGPRRLNPFVRILQRRAERSPEQPAIQFRQGSDFATWTWRDLWHRAGAAASGLHRAGVRPGDHVVLAVPQVQDAVISLFGIWTVGAVPIQVGLPARMADPGSLIPHLAGTAERLDARAVVVAAPLAGSTRNPGPVKLISTDQLKGSHGALNGALDGALRAPGPALIQLTSGSLGRPRGVVIPAERLMRHLESISRALPAGEDAVGVSWLPLYHDMGLIGGLLYPLYNGFTVHLLSPMDFRNRPYAWLETLSQVGATHTTAPPSAYALATRLARRAISHGLDFGSLRCAMVGAESIPPAVLRGFSTAFAPCGFRPEAFFPVYGLAEATVAVTFPAPLAKTRFDRVDAAALQRFGRAVPSQIPDTLELTGVGRAIPGTEIRIAQESGEPAPERVIGEIQVRSDSAMTSYYRDPAATRSVYRDDWLRTGDQGYIADGYLYVTGRIKELIIRGGQNLLPQVVEEVAQTVQGVRQGNVAVVGIRSQSRGTERAVLVAETAMKRELHRELVAQISTALKARALEVDEIKLVPPHSLPRTTSGKLRRRALATMLEQPAL